MIVINNSNDKYVKVVGVFSNDETPVEYDVSSLPQPEVTPGKTPELFYDKETKKVFYKYTDLPKTEIELLKAENKQIKDRQSEQDTLIMQLLIGGN